MQLNYEEFKQKLKETILDYLPGKLQHTEPVFLVSVNGKEEETVLLLNVEEEELKGVSLRIKDMYQHYLKRGDYDKGMQELFQSASIVMDINVLDDAAHARENVIMQLLNTEVNEKLLSVLPHREYEDMSIVYRLVLEGDEQGYATLLVTDNMVDALGLSENELYDIALNNIQRVLQPKVKSLQAAIYERLYNTPYEASGMENMGDSQVYIMTGMEGRYGAAIMLDKDTMQAVYEQLQMNFYVVPMSTDECVICKSNETTLEKMKELIEALPFMTNEQEPALSEHVYYYDGQEQMLSIATNPIGEDETAEHNLEEDEGPSMGGM